MIKRIDELDLAELATILPNVEQWMIPVKLQGDTHEAYKIPVAKLVIVSFDNEVEYETGRRIEFNNLLFKVLDDTEAGETPVTTPAKFKYLGGVDASNTITHTSPATLQGYSGIVTFTDGGIGGMEVGQFRINNALITATSTLQLGIMYDVDSFDGHPFLLHYKTYEGYVLFYVGNFSPDGSDQFSTWFKIIG